ncbi:MAG: cupin domain-containing protein [Dehalococcoidia bacterium]|nr:cupin domain-containing protein [Dehalococcoidia bacterium]
MKVQKMSAVKKEAFVVPLMTGTDVTRQTLVPESTDFSIAIINFGKGIRNKFHTHSSDQVLLVTEGTGYVVTDQEKRKVNVGDIILVTAGEKHWHGAGPESAFSHITLTKPGNKLVQLED